MKFKFNPLSSIALLVVGEVALIVGLYKIFERPITEFILNSVIVSVNAFCKIKEKLYILTHRKLYTYLNKEGKAKAVWVIDCKK